MLRRVRRVVGRHVAVDPHVGIERARGRILDCAGRSRLHSRRIIGLLVANSRVLQSLQRCARRADAPGYASLPSAWSFPLKAYTLDPIVECADRNHRAVILVLARID